MADFPASAFPSPSRSTCASRKCSPACAATWRSRFSARPRHAQPSGGRDRKHGEEGARRRRHLHPEERRRAVPEDRRRPPAAGRFGLNVDDIQNDLKALLEGATSGTVIEQGRRAPPSCCAARTACATRRPISPPAPQRCRRRQRAAGQRRQNRAHRWPGQGRPRKCPALRGGPVQRPRPRPGRLRRRGQGQRRPRRQAAPGYRLAWGGQFENQQRAAARLMMVVPVALALIFFLLFSTFGSVRQALLVLSNIPFAMIGGIFGLLAVRRIPVGAGLGRLHRPARHRRAQRRGDGDLLQPAAGARPADRRSRRRRRQTPPAAGADDRQHHRLRPGAAALRQRPGLGGAAPAGHRGDRRPGQLATAADPGQLLPVGPEEQILYRRFGSPA
jgi:hypothetical protein